MCIHNKRELSQQINYYRNILKHTTVSGVIVRDEQGRFVGSWLCDASKPQSIADSVAAVHSWHPSNVTDLSMVNSWRRENGLGEVDANGLLKPLQVPNDSTDNDDLKSTRAEVAAWMRNMREANYAIA